MRDGSCCILCGCDIYDWQEDEFDILPGMCPECSMEAEEWGVDESDLDYLF